MKILKQIRPDRVYLDENRSIIPVQLGGGRNNITHPSRSNPKVGSNRSKTHIPHNGNRAPGGGCEFSIHQEPPAKSLQKSSRDDCFRRETGHIMK